VPARITILGLGPGDPGLLTRRAWQVLTQADEAYLRTGRHPVAEHLPDTLSVHTFDNLYDELPDFESVYEAIVERLIELARRPQGVVYAVPGDPMVGEATVQQLCERAGEGDFEVESTVSVLSSPAWRWLPLMPWTACMSWMRSRLRRGTIHPFRPMFRH